MSLDVDRASEGFEGSVGWVDPYADFRRPTRPARPPASTSARIVAIALDFLILKAVTTLLVFSTAMVGLFVDLLGASDEDVGAIASRVVWFECGVFSLLYFVVWPATRQGCTVGRRLVGLSPVADQGRDARSSTAVHDTILFLLPCVLLDPVAVLTTRDLAVLAAWCGMQVLRRGDGGTVLERAAGIRLVQQR